ncbi:hypothetical protein CR513_56394, partial [Mucuna pruriens]
MGYSQEHGKDYNEIFVPLSRMDIHLLHNERGWKIFQLDVKVAFLHGTLSEDVVGLQQSQMSKHFSSNEERIYAKGIRHDRFREDECCNVQMGLNMSKEICSGNFENAIQYAILLCLVVNYAEMKEESSSSKWVDSLLYIRTTRLDLMFVVSLINGKQENHFRYVFLMGGGFVTWSSRKQPIVTLSITIAKFITVGMHIDVGFHLLRDLIRDEVIELVHYGTQNQDAISLRESLLLVS